MGAEPYEYTVPYDEDVQAALDKLRAKVFQEGAFRGSEMSPSSPQEAMAMMEEEGTGSILDIMQVSQQPGFCCAAPLSAAELQQYFGTVRPTRTQVAQNYEWAESIERGHCRYVVLYDNDAPTEIYFFGYSFD